MQKKIFTLFIALVWLPVIWGQTSLSSRIGQLLETLPPGSEVGISVYDLTDRKPLYVYRDKKLSRPASTLKLLTAITALSRPEGNEPFRTEVWYKGIVEQDTLHGDLYVVGGFDPEFDERSMNALIDSVRAFPFSVIDGKVYGDVSMTDSLYWGNGWAWDDTPEAYQPYLSPLMYHKGVVTVTVAPGLSKGNPASVTCLPRSSYYSVTNTTRTRTPSAGSLEVTRDWLHNRNRLIVSGNVENRRSREVNIVSSQDFFMHAFLEKLHERGISTPSTYDFIRFVPDSVSTRMGCWETGIQEVITQLMKESDNLNAEALLYRLGGQATGRKQVSAKEGIAEVMKLIRRLGHHPENYKIADGSGLSNYNYLSPELLVDFLKFAYSEPDIFQKLYKSLPVSGVDGTLEFRMKEGKTYKNVRAKTGSFTAINALAGYLRAANGHDIAFAIMNQNILSGAKARGFQNAVCEELCR